MDQRALISKCNPVGIGSILSLNAYFDLIITFAQKYQKNAGVGTVVALVSPNVVIISVV